MGYRLKFAQKRYPVSVSVSVSVSVRVSVSFSTGGGLNTTCHTAYEAPSPLTPHAGDIVRPACEKRRGRPCIGGAGGGGMIKKTPFHDTIYDATSSIVAPWGPRWWGVRQRGSIRTPGGLGRSPPLQGGSATPLLGGSVVRNAVTVKLRIVFQIT